MAVACRVGSGTRAGCGGVGAIITIACGVAKETGAGRHDQCTVLCSVVYCRGRTRECRHVYVPPRSRHRPLHLLEIVLK